MSGTIQATPTDVRETIRDGYAYPTGGAVAGQYRGERVVALPNHAKPLAEETAESSFEFGVAQQEKALAKRIIKTRVTDRSRLDRVADINDLLDKLKDLKKETLERVLEVLARQHCANADELRRGVRDQLGEPAHQYAALLALRKRQQEGGAPPEQLAITEEALERLLQEEGPAIRAALNTGQVAAEFADRGLGEVSALRDTYRDAVLKTPELSPTLDRLLERYGPAELPQAVAYLIKALGADLAADGASIDRRKLHEVLDDLYRLEVLTGMLEDCATLVARYRTPGHDYQATDLLKEVLALHTNKWPRPETIAALPTRLGQEEPAGEIHCLRDFKELVRLIPLKTYAEPEQRGRMLDTIQQALDATIEREEQQADPDTASAREEQST
jgi:type III secretion protein W